MTNKLSLYLHIPFCIRKCNYCAFYSLPNQSEEVKESYLEALLRQIAFFRTEREISSIYFGGGTPTYFGAERLCKLLTKLYERFDIADCCEITVEVNPATVDLSSLKMLKEAGFNRLSVGIQSANDNILSLLGRAHSFKDAEQCISDAALAGFENISADVIFALPNQTNSEFASGLEKILSLGVKHISAYSLQLEEGTPFYKNFADYSFPDEESEEAQYETLCKLIKNHGMKHYEISSFALDGYESRHNMNYWARGEYMGFGAAAHSFYNNKRFSAPNDINSFIEKSKIGAFAPTNYHEIEPIPPEEAEEERIMLSLRTALGAKIPEPKLETAKKIAELGHGSLENGVLTLNSRGFRVSNYIIGQLI